MRYDFIIVGGGLVGLSLAAALRDTSYAIALIDAKAPAANDARLFALNQVSCEWLRSLNLWEKVADQAAPIHQVHVSHRGHFGAVRLQREVLGLPHLGQVVPARLIEAALNEAVSQQANVTIYRPATVTAIQCGDTAATISLAAEGCNQQLVGRFVIAADGSHSTVRQLFAVPTKTRDYQQAAIVTQTTLARSHHHIAYERLLEAGALAMLPLAPQRVATIWTMPIAAAKKAMALSDDDFLADLQAAFGYRLGRLQKIGKRDTYPLHFIQANPWVNAQVMLIGNAAHTLHPISALGLNLALDEVAVIAKHAREKSMQPLSFTNTDWQRIGSQLQAKQATRLQIASRLPLLFEGKIKRYFPAMLSVGMLAFDMMPAWKKTFINRMMGCANEQ